MKASTDQERTARIITFFVVRSMQNKLALFSMAVVGISVFKLLQQLSVSPFSSSVEIFLRNILIFCFLFVKQMSFEKRSSHMWTCIPYIQKIIKKTRLTFAKSQQISVVSGSNYCNMIKKRFPWSNSFTLANNQVTSETQEESTPSKLRWRALQWQLTAFSRQLLLQTLNLICLWKSSLRLCS